MGHYAKVKDGIVQQVIVADQNFVNGLPSESGVTWIKTSYNTYGGVHYAPRGPDDDRTPDGGTPLRKNFAGVGMIYDSARDAFYGPKPFDNWTLNEDTCFWEAPVAYPTDGKIYERNVTTNQWDEMPFLAE